METRFVWDAVTTWELLSLSFCMHPSPSDGDETSRQLRKQEEKMWRSA